VLLERIFAPRLNRALVFLAPTLAFSVLLLPNTTSMNAMIAAGFLGFGLGAKSMRWLTSPHVPSDSDILGESSASHGRVRAGPGIRPTLFGKIYDQFQSYQLALWIAAGNFCCLQRPHHDLAENRPAIHVRKGGHLHIRTRYATMATHAWTGARSAQSRELQNRYPLSRRRGNRGSLCGKMAGQPATGRAGVCARRAARAAEIREHTEVEGATRSGATFHIACRGRNDCRCAASVSQPSQGALGH